MMAKRKKAKAARKANTPTTKNSKPDGSISSGIYDAVQKLTANGKMKRSDAFRQIAKESGRKEGTVAVNYYYVAKKRGGGKKSPAKKVAAKATKTAAPKKAGIAATIYDAIEQLMAGGNMKRAAAFRQHAKATGRKEGTVAVNYYYAAKKHGAKPAKRGPGRPKGGVAVRRSGSPSNVASLLKALADLIRTQEAELAALRREGERFAALRKLLAN